MEDSEIRKVRKFQKLNQLLFVIDELRKIGRQLHKLDENACNYGLTDKQERREERLEKRAADYAKKIGFIAYHQGDPRGCSLYLTLKGIDYSRGIAIF